MRTALYLGTGADGHSHFYSLDLSDTGAVPSAVQTTAVTFPGALANPQSNSCQVVGYTSQADLHDPTSLFALVQLPAVKGDGSCGGVEPVFNLVSYGAAATAQPVPTPIPAPCSVGMDSVYTDQGILGGLLLTDANNDLLFFTYHGSNFTQNPNPIATITMPPTMFGSYHFAPNFASNSTATEVFAAAVAPAGQAYHLYGVNASGTTLFDYTAQSGAGPGLTDANNLYFTDSNPAGTNTYIYAVPLEQAVASPTLLATLPISVYGSVSLIGSMGGGAALLFLGTTGTGSSQNSTLYSVSVPGGVISTVTTYGSAPYSSSNLFLDDTGTYLYANNVDSHESMVSTVNGQVLQSTANSYFLGETAI